MGLAGAPAVGGAGLNGGGTLHDGRPLNGDARASEISKAIAAVPFLAHATSLVLLEFGVEGEIGCEWCR